MFLTKKLGVEFSPTKLKFLYTTGKNQIIDKSDCEIGSEFGAEEALKSYLSRVKPKLAKIKASLKNPQTVIRFWSPPPMSRRDLDKAIKLSLENIFPIDMSGYTMSYRLLSYAPEAKVMAAAVPTDLAREISGIFKRNKIVLDSIDVYQNCIMKYLTSVNETDAGIFYRLTERNYFISIKNGIPEYIRDYDCHNLEAGDFLLKSEVDLKKIYCVDDNDKPIFPTDFVFPDGVHVEYLCDGFEGLQGLLKDIKVTKQYSEN